MLGAKKIFHWGLAAFFAASLFLCGQSHPALSPNTPVKIETLSPEQAREAIETFRAARFGGDFCLRFSLTHMPRKGAEIVYEGIMWGKGFADGSALRLVFWKKDDPQQRTQYLLLGGKNARVFKGGLGESARELSAAQIAEPLAPGLLYSPFDAMMPFIHWPTYVYQGPKRVQSRACDMFLFYAPDKWRADNPAQRGVLVALDRTFNALIYAQLISDSGEKLRSFRIVDLKKVREQWIVKRIDYTDERTRDKDRFAVWAAAVQITLPAEIFTVDALQMMPELPAFEVF